MLKVVAKIGPNKIEIEKTSEINGETRYNLSIDDVTVNNYSVEEFQDLSDFILNSMGFMDDN
jgi:hypothetical protein